MGSAGAVVVTKDFAEKIPTPKVPIKSTVGAGDSMVAGMVLCLSEMLTCSKAVQYGVACGTAAIMNPGTELCRKEDADRIFKMIREMMAQRV